MPGLLTDSQAKFLEPITAHGPSYGLKLTHLQAHVVNVWSCAKDAF